MYVKTLFIKNINEIGDCTPFLEYMLETMSSAYYTAYNIFQKNIK